MKAGQIADRASAFIAGLAAKQGCTPAELIAGVFDVEFVPVSTKTARRLREIERAADLTPGAVVASLIEAGEAWWSKDDGGLLADWIREGWELDDPAGVLAAVSELQATWAREDAGEWSGEADPETLARVIAEDYEWNERAKAANAGGAL